MFCSKCGQKNKDSSKFCSDCGNILSDPVTSSKNESNKSAEERADEIKSAVSKKSKEATSTFFYLVKPLVKFKTIVPALIVLLMVVFWGDGAKYYKDYQYEKKKLAREKRETFTDSTSRLMWQDNKNKLERDYDGALSYCRETKYAGYNDWRLPSKEELLTIVDKGQKNTVIIDSFKYPEAGYYWTSTSGVHSASLYVYFYLGSTDNYDDSRKSYFRCVRNKSS